MTFDPNELIEAGYIPTGYVEFNKVGTYAYMRQAAIGLDVTLESIRQFRIADGKWQVFLKPTYQKGFVDVPVLNF